MATPVKLDPQKGIPQVEITVGNIQSAIYSCWLEKMDDTEIASWNTNKIDLSSATGIKKVQDLNQIFFFWKLKVLKVISNVDTKYKVAINFTQDNKPMCDPIICQGTFSGDVQLCYDAVLFHL